MALTDSDGKKKKKYGNDRASLKAKEFSSWIKKKPKEYSPTEATAHMKAKKKFWIKKKKKDYTNQ